MIGYRIAASEVVGVRTTVCGVESCGTHGVGLVFQATLSAGSSGTVEEPMVGIANCDFISIETA